MKWDIARFESATIKGGPRQPAYYITHSRRLGRADWKLELHPWVLCTVDPDNDQAPTPLSHAKCATVEFLDEQIESCLAQFPQDSLKAVPVAGCPKAKDIFEEKKVKPELLIQRLHQSRKDQALARPPVVPLFPDISQGKTLTRWSTNNSARDLAW
jgi:hypothetical protein